MQASAADGIEISFRPDCSLYDGRYANVGWLQELPKQVTSLSWDNAALMSMSTMGDLKVEENDAIEITLNGRKVVAPVLMSPGHPDGAVTVHLGFGRGAEAGTRGCGGRLRCLHAADGSTAPYYSGGATMKKVSGTYDLCVTKVHSLETRGKLAQHDLHTKHLSDGRVLRCLATRRWSAASFATRRLKRRVSRTKTHGLCA